MCQRVDEPSVNYYGIEDCDRVYERAMKIMQRRAETMPNGADEEKEMQAALDEARIEMHAGPDYDEGDL